MKIALLVHGYPPELLGGTELSVQGLARGLVRAGHSVVVVAGSIEPDQGMRVSEARDGDVRVLRIHRSDLHFEHWQKSASAPVAEALEGILERERFDLVHVHHWIRLTRDLVAIAARAGVPSVVTLHDLWTTCLVSFRVPPGETTFCEAPLGPSPCLSCAARVPPRTPWVSTEAGFMAIAERRADLVRELQLARAVVAPTAAHAAAVLRFLGVPGEGLDLRVVPHGRDLAWLRSSASHEPKPQPGRLRLGIWGHVHALKGQDLILEAMRRTGRAADISLHVAGGTPEAGFVARLRAESADLDVHWHGPFELERLAEHPVAQVDAMISASRGHESWGLVVDEAAALGLPMILPRRGAFAERFADASSGALLFESGDADALAALLRSLLEDPAPLVEARRGLLQRGDLVPSLETHLTTLLAIYAEALAAGAPEAPAEDWWARRLRASAEQQWDESLARRDAKELGFE